MTSSGHDFGDGRSLPRRRAARRFAFVAVAYLLVAGMGEGGGCGGADLRETLGLAELEALYLDLFVRKPASSERGVEEFCLAASDGDIKAAVALALIYRYGTPEVTPDTVEAYKWYTLAAAQGHQGAAASRDQLADEMAPAEIEAAERAATRWRPGNCNLREAAATATTG